MLQPLLRAANSALIRGQVLRDLLEVAEWFVEAVDTAVANPHVTEQDVLAIPEGIAVEPLREAAAILEQVGRTREALALHTIVSASGKVPAAQLSSADAQALWGHPDRALEILKSVNTRGMTPEAVANLHTKKDHLRTLAARATSTRDVSK
jgi:hypothetical protein